MTGGELTWGQRFVWDILESLAPANHYLNLRFRVHLPPDATRERVLAALRTLVRRHEALRTRFPLGPGGEPRQRLDPAGDPPVEIRETGPGRVRRIAEQDEERLWRRPFRHDAEWPLRVSVIVAGGRPRQAVFVLSHLAADAWGCAVLRREFLDLLRDGSAEPAVAGWQPLARAAYEMSEAGRAAGDLALGYWRRVLETMPQTAFPVLPEAGETPLFPGVGLHSVALAAAANTLAARHRAGPASVLLAVLATVIGIRTGTEVVPLHLAAGNRFTSKDANSVGTFYQAAPALIRLDATLAGTIRNAHRASTLAYLRGQSDPRQVARLLADANARRGLAIDLQTTVNVVPEPGVAGPPPTGDVAGLREMTASTRVSDLDGRDSERLKLYLHVKSLRTRAVLEFFSDSRFLDAAAARKLLAGLELVLIEMLAAGDLSADRVAGLVGIAPLARPENGALVDNCRVDVDAIGGLLAGLPGVEACRVFVAGGRLVAEVETARPATPEQVHAALLGRLDGNLTMTPQWYVVSRAAGEREPALHGSGRGENSGSAACCP